MGHFPTKTHGSTGSSTVSSGGAAGGSQEPRGAEAPAPPGASAEQRPGGAERGATLRRRPVTGATYGVRKTMGGE